MSECVFMSKQASTECFSIIKIKKISKLSNGKRSAKRLGKIQFETEVSGEEIGFSLYTNQTEMNMKELTKRKEHIGLEKLKKCFNVPKAVKLTRHMWEIRSEKFCDVNFIFEDDERVVYANKNVLVAASEVFEAHFNNEGFVDNKSVHFVDSSLYSFNKLLEFIYTGTVQFTTWRLAFDLLYLSKKYLMSDLEDLSRDVIIDFSNFDSGNLLKVREQSQETNDNVIEDHIEENVKDDIYEVINSESFLNCKFATVEWLLSLDELFIDEWSVLCSIYKWALHNGVTAFCQRVGDETDEPLECLHALLEYVRYQNIGGHSLKRFLKLPKLPEIVDVGELKQSFFDSLLKDDSYLDIGTDYYPRYRNGTSVYVEIDIGNTEERKMKNIHVRKGHVLGFEVKVEQHRENVDNGEHWMDIVFNFQYLYGSTVDKKDIQLYFSLDAIRTKSRFSDSNNDTSVGRSCRLIRGEWKEFRLSFEDYRGYLSSKIEDFSVNCGGANNSGIIAFEMDIS